MSDEQENVLILSGAGHSCKFSIRPLRDCKSCRISVWHAHAPVLTDISCRTARSLIGRSIHPAVTIVPTPYELLPKAV
ncbi:hypothetical protein BDR03DRAFT_954603 [Suillus americanus]|nr:hypothetical protein BDR03DRAFT_954603 [Suillus americanus]